MALLDTVRNFSGLRALVIGDAMVDSYLRGPAARLCSEGPVPVVIKEGEQHAPGGAANTAANVRALGADVMFVGLVADDQPGRLLRQALRERGIDDAWLIADAAGRTIHKMRILANGQYVVRLDDGEVDPAAHLGELLDELDRAYRAADVVVVSDYGGGVASDRLIARLGELCAERRLPIVVDSKDLARFRPLRPTLVTPNLPEARALAGMRRATSDAAPDEAELEILGEQLLRLTEAEHVAITLAAEGVYVQSRADDSFRLPSLPVRNPNDVGAGDTFAAAAALALAAGSQLLEAIRIGVDAAVIAVSKPGTSVTYQRELLDRILIRESRSVQPRARVPTAELGSPRSVDRLARLLEAERSQARTIVFTNGVFDILHAGHVHLLRQAKEMGDVLVVGVNSDRSVRRLKGRSRPINNEDDRLAVVAALDSVDHVVLFDEDTPVNLIRALRPDIHVKGGDYRQETLPEAAAVREVGGRIVILPRIGGLSTTGVIDRIATLETVVWEGA